MRMYHFLQPAWPLLQPYQSRPPLAQRLPREAAAVAEAAMRGIASLPSCQAAGKGQTRVAMPKAKGISGQGAATMIPTMMMMVATIHTDKGHHDIVVPHPPTQAGHRHVARRVMKSSLHHYPAQRQSMNHGFSISAML